MASLADPQVATTTLAAWSMHTGEPVVDAALMRTKLAEGSIPSEFSEVARRRGTAPALTLGGETWSYSELAYAVETAAASLSDLGARPGVAVMLVADTGIREIVAYLGTLRTGAAVVLAHPASTVVELEKLGEDSQAEVVVAGGAALRNCAAAQMPWARELVGLGPGDRSHAAILLSDARSAKSKFATIDPDSPAVLAYTSGTTGRPKCAPLSHRNLLASIRGAMLAWRWSQNDHLVHSLPISHQHGLSGIHATLLAGSRATILADFDPGELLTTASASGATVLFGVPAIHQRLIDHVGNKGRFPASLRLVTSGSAPLPVDIARSFEDAFGHRIVERYGTTESGLNVSNPYAGAREPGHVGIPLPGVEIALIGEDGRRSTPDEPGEVVVRGPQVFNGYRDDDPDAFIEGWFRTGDLGVVDPRTGYLKIVGRIREMIITGGMNVYPREVEDAIREADQVADVAVIGVPSSRWGEEVVAFVAPDTVDRKTLWDIVASRLAPYKRPKRFQLVREVPRSPTGKVDKTRLADLDVPSGGWEGPAGGI